MKRTNRIFIAYNSMMFLGTEYRHALWTLKMANLGYAPKSCTMSYYNVCKARYLNAMLELRIAYTYPKESAK